MRSPAFLGEVTLLMLLRRGGRRLGIAGLRHRGLRRRLLRRQWLRLLRRPVLVRLIRLELMECLGYGRIDSVLETRRRLRWLRGEVLRLGGRVLHS